MTAETEKDAHEKDAQGASRLKSHVNSLSQPPRRVDEIPPVMVLGEICHDIFNYGSVKRISPEAPVPVFESENVVMGYGMMWNVASQLMEFGLQVKHPHMGRQFKDTDCFCGCKTRYVDKQSDQHLLRVDEPMDVTPFDDGICLDLIANGDVSAVVVSDYDKGYLSLGDLTALGGISSSSNVPSFIDTKRVVNKDNAEVFSRFDYVKVNDEEFHRAESAGVDFEEFKNVLHTRGSNGASGYWTDPFRAKVHQLPSSSLEVFDVCGAGDFFLAAFVYHMLVFGNKNVALTFAVDVASLSVKKRGCEVVGMDEIRKSVNYPILTDGF